MQVNYCFGCMEHIESYPCPHCGYVPSGNATAYTLRPGSILRGKYLVGKVLGQGGFGITYIGMDLALQRKVAIKEFYPANCVGRETGTNRVVWYDSPQAQSAMQAGQEQFLKEARKMSRVSNISTVVHVFDVFQENGTAYICMEFIEGQTLQQLLKLTGPLPWVKAREIFLPVIQTMAQVHQQGLIHRDLSPDNLMIQRDGTVKILDLGAAKDLNLNTGISSMQVAKGGFSPLEQYLSSGESGSWTDVYALAATLYYALTGVVPPTAMDRLNRDTLRWDLPQLQVLPPEVHKALQHAMAVRKEDRIQTMEDFAAELEYTISRTSKSVPSYNIKGTMADFAAESEHITRRIFKSMPPINIKVAAALIAVVLLGIGILNSGKEPPEETLSVPETLETVPETTEAIPETTESASSISVSEAEALIADIAGMSYSELHTKYREAVKLEKFWKSEGDPVERLGSGGSYLQQFLNRTIDTPLLDQSGNPCGRKYMHPHQYNGSNILDYFDGHDRILLTETSPDTLGASRKKYFYDSDGILTRTIFVGANIVDIRYTENGQSQKNKIIIDNEYNQDTYYIEVYDPDNNCALKKIYDYDGNLIS